ncbi:MAG: S9 family peptidase [Burkholderiales bacterium]|nr:S9 family peptidase [Burkholderiales bacterium]
MQMTLTSRLTIAQLVCATLLTYTTSFGAVAANTAADEAIVKPNEHLTVQGIPAIPQSLADQLAPYTEFRPRAALGWHPRERSLLISTRPAKGSTVQLHLLKKPLGQLEQLTDFPDPVREAQFEPKQGRYIVFAKDTGGNEASQLYRLDLADRKVTLLTDPNERHHLSDWSHQGKHMLMHSTQLDKTAQGNSRKEVTSDLYVLDPLQPQAKRKLASLPGGGWGEFTWSPDDKTIVGINRKSINEASIWSIDVKTGAYKQLLPLASDAGKQISYGQLEFSRDGKSLLVTSDVEGEFLQLMKIRLADLQRTIISKDIPWDLHEIKPAEKSDIVAAVVNRDGLPLLQLFDSAKAKALPIPSLPVGAVSHLHWKGNQEIAFDINSAQSPGEIYSLNLKSGKAEQWTRPDADILNTDKFRSAEIVRWKSFDDRTISGLIARPPAQNSAGKKFEGPRPVLIAIHGGPEAQAQVSFLGRNSFLVNELGITLIQPNVRGSAGYGKSFLKLDNGMLREDSVKDIGALLDWIATQPDLDAKHVLVMGGSYGGYMSLAVATHYADRIVGAIDIVGISHFITFLERTESYRRDLRRVEYGDERDPAMRAFLDKIAPLNNADKITKPLFVIQGKNDPRVPLAEAEQIVARVSKNNVPVWYLMADNEGHGFQRKPNLDFYLYSVTRFMQEYLLK